MVVCPECRTTNPDGSRLCTGCSSMLPPPAAAVPAPDAVPARTQLPQQPWQAAPPAAPATPGYAPADPVAALVPYKNGPALTAYYLGLFSGFPLVGLFLAAGALYLGSRGLRQFRDNPAVRGRTHALVGIVTGVIGGLFNLLLLGLVIAALASGRGGGGDAASSAGALFSFAP